ncbi:MAG: hypothetical protein ACXVDD_16210, partial [Polyangia bacterium]
DTRASATVGHLDMKGVAFHRDGAPNESVLVSPDGDRVLAQESDGVVRLWSAGGGPSVALETLPPNELCGGFLRDGRIAIGHGSAQGRPDRAVTARVHVYSQQGQLQHAVELGFGQVSCVVDGTRLLVAVNPRPNPRQDQQQLWLVDGEQGTARALDARLRILLPLAGVVARPSPERLLVGDVEGGLVEVEPATGKTRMLMRGQVR